MCVSIERVLLSCHGASVDCAERLSEVVSYYCCDRDCKTRIIKTKIPQNCQNESHDGFALDILK